MSTYVQSNEDALANRKWYVVDAAKVPVGRLASEVAILIRGKHKPTFTRHNDGGDFVVVVNAAQAVFTGNKPTTKVYHWHTNHPGGIKEIAAGQLMEKNPERVIRLAVKGMLPKTKLARGLLTKLKVYTGADHPHKAQKPEVYTVKSA